MPDNDEILFDRRGGIGHVTLNRPKALNALNLAMVRAFDRQLIEWAGDDAISAVVVTGAEREDGRHPFCAGGDVRSATEIAKSDDPGPAIAFFAEEYTLNRRIHTYPKPYVALLDGITMGGGFGLSVHGSHRVCSERVLFAMPETGIGLYPDVGGTYILARCPGQTGMYLALSGVHLKAADTIYAGVGTHFVSSDRFGELEAALYDADFSGDAYGQVSSIIGRYTTSPGDPPLAAHRRIIDRCFSGDSVESIVVALEGEGGPWAGKVAETIATKSPTSLKITFEALRRARDLEFDQAMQMEFRMTMGCLKGHDFFEGVRAVLVDKDHNPQWSPAKLEDVTDALVAAYFGPQPEGELSFA
ncbi:MAG: enoyl-CoA hydratase [Rhodospirillaceae bacterium]|nr:enoyl-CoA hydratase [Rhodospirillaceae bacterium]